MVAAIRPSTRSTRVVVLALACLALFSLQECSSGVREDYEARAIELTSPDPAIRYNALGVLTRARNRSEFDDSPFDLDGKYELFRKVIEIGDLGHAYSVAYLLSRLPEDTELVQFTVDVVENDRPRSDDRDAELLLLVGSLAYIEKQRPHVFQDYFRGKNYEDLNEIIRLVFDTGDVVGELKYQHHRRLVLAFLQWKPPSGVADGEVNPFRPKLLELGGDLVLTLTRMYPSSDIALPLPLIWILGEIGHQDAFDILFQEYLARPSMRTAVSLGSCLGSLSMNKLFEAPFTPETTRGVLQYIYGDKWQSVKGLSADELKRNLSENFDEIRAECKGRSIPQSG